MSSETPLLLSTGPGAGEGSHRAQDNTSPPNRIAVSPSEAARLLGIGRTFLYQALKSGDLKSHKVGHRRLITMTAINTWLAAHECGGSA